MGTCDACGEARADSLRRSRNWKTGNVQHCLIFRKRNESDIIEACTLAEDYIKELDSSVIDGGFLQETYRFDPEIVDESPHFSPEEEEYARSGVFVEVI